MRNLDVGALTAIFDLLQQHYPERLGELWFLNAPFLFWGLWSVVKPCVKPSTREKIRFLSNSEKGELLAQTIPASVSGMSSTRQTWWCGCGSTPCQCAWVCELQLLSVCL